MIVDIFASRSVHFSAHWDSIVQGLAHEAAKRI